MNSLDTRTLSTIDGFDETTNSNSIYERWSHSIHLIYSHFFIVWLLFGRFGQTINNGQLKQTMTHGVDKLMFNPRNRYSVFRCVYAHLSYGD